MEQHGDSGRIKADAINEESREVIILIFCVRVGIWGLDNNTHDRHVQVDIDIGAAGYGTTGLSDKGFKVWMEDSKIWNYSYYRRRHEGLSVEN